MFLRTSTAAEEIRRGWDRMEHLVGTRGRKFYGALDQPTGEYRVCVEMKDGDDAQALKVASRLVRDAGFDPVEVGSLQRSKLFEQGGPLYGAEMSAQEMREKLKTLP